MRTIHVPLPLFALFAFSSLGCPSKDKESGTPACESSVEATWPEDGASDAYYRDPVEVRQDDPYTGTFTLSGPEGAVTGATSTNVDGDVVYFTPDAPLATLASYTASYEGCSATTSFSFQTSDFGNARTGTPEGLTFAVDLTEARFTEPYALSGMLGAALNLQVLMQAVEVVDGTSVTFVGTVAAPNSEPAVQDYCAATVDFPAGDFSADPFFHLPPSEASFALPTHTLHLVDLEISGTFSPDGQRFGGGVLSAIIDVRNNVGAFQQMLTVKTGDDVCDALAGFQTDCAPCADGENYCLGIRADHIYAEPVAGLGLDAVEQANCHALCDNNAKDCVL